MFFSAPRFFSFEMRAFLKFIRVNIVSSCSAEKKVTLRRDTIFQMILDKAAYSVDALAELSKLLCHSMISFNERKSSIKQNYAVKFTG